MAKAEMSMKLLIDTKNKRVLFAEAGKDCVDFLFHIMCLPVGTVVKLSREEGMVGCLANLYESIEKLNEIYIQLNTNKNLFLNPNPPAGACSVPLLRIEAAAPAHEKKFYGCSNHCSYYVTDDSNTTCPHCHRNMTTAVMYLSPSLPPVDNSGSTGGGFVKEVVTYMVMDDLVVNPMSMSAISNFLLLNTFQVKEPSALQEKVVNVGVDQASKLLKASLKSKKVLTDVFLNNEEIEMSEELSLFNISSMLKCLKTEALKLLKASFKSEKVLTDVFLNNEEMEMLAELSSQMHQLNAKVSEY